MNYLFDAISERYRNQPTLTLIGRELVETRGGDLPDDIAAHVSFSAELLEVLDDFSSDTETWRVTFGLRSGSVKPDDSRTWLETMNDHFVDRRLISFSSAFEWCGTEFVSASDAEMEGHTFSAECVMDFIVDRSIKRPMARGLNGCC